MMTSNPATNGGVSAEAPAFSLASSTFTLCPRSAATSATSLPVLPIPRTKIRIFPPLSRALHLNPIYHIEHRLVRVRKENPMQAPHGLLHVFFIDHEAHVYLARPLRDHPHIHMADCREDLSRNAVVPANV